MKHQVRGGQIELIAEEPIQQMFKTLEHAVGRPRPAVR